MRRLIYLSVVAAASCGVLDGFSAHRSTISSSSSAEYFFTPSSWMTSGVSKEATFGGCTNFSRRVTSESASGIVALYEGYYERLYFGSEAANRVWADYPTTSRRNMDFGPRAYKNYHFNYKPTSRIIADNRRLYDVTNFHAFCEWAFDNNVFGGGESSFRLERTGWNSPYWSSKTLNSLGANEPPTFEWSSHPVTYHSWTNTFATFDALEPSSSQSHYKRWNSGVNLAADILGAVSYGELEGLLDGRTSAAFTNTFENVMLTRFGLPMTNGEDAACWPYAPSKPDTYRLDIQKVAAANQAFSLMDRAYYTLLPSFASVESNSNYRVTHSIAQDVAFSIVRTNGTMGVRLSTPITGGAWDVRKSEWSISGSTAAGDPYVDIRVFGGTSTVPQGPSLPMIGEYETYYIRAQDLDGLLSSQDVVVYSYEPFILDGGNSVRASVEIWDATLTDLLGTFAKDFPLPNSALTNATCWIRVDRGYDYRRTIDGCHITFSRFAPGPEGFAEVVATDAAKAFILSSETDVRSLPDAGLIYHPADHEGLAVYRASFEPYNSQADYSNRVMTAYSTMRSRVKSAVDTKTPTNDADDYRKILEMANADATKVALEAGFAVRGGRFVLSADDTRIWFGSFDTDGTFVFDDAGRGQERVGGITLNLDAVLDHPAATNMLNEIQPITANGKLSTIQRVDFSFKSLSRTDED